MQKLGLDRKIGCFNVFTLGLTAQGTIISMNLPSQKEPKEKEGFCPYSLKNGKEIVFIC